MEKLSTAQSTPVELTTEQMVLVAGGSPKGTWIAGLDSPKGTWVAGLDSPKGTWVTDLSSPKGTW